jgi:hypothetical protein
MAEKKQNGTTMDFGLGGLTDAIAASANALRVKQQAELQTNQQREQANQQLAEIASQQASVSQQLVDSLAPILKTVSDTQAGKEEQEALRSSGNPLDFLTSIGNEIVDPGKYTASGRSKRVAEATQMMNVSTQVAGLKQAAMADLGKAVEANFAAGQGELNAATLTLQQQNELLDSQVKAVSTKAGVLQTQAAMQETALMQMSTQQLKALATKSNGQPIDVDGIMIQPGILQARMEAVDERELISENRALARQANRLDLDAKLAKKELETMSVEELRPMLLNGSDKYSLADIQSVYQTKQTAMSAAIERDSKIFQFTDFGASVLAPAIQDLERTLPNIPKGSPLESAAQGYRSMLVAVTSSLQEYQKSGQPIPVELIDSANKTLVAARESFDKRIEQEAKFKSKGDKDMNDIYLETYRGNQPPQASVESAIQTRLKKGAPLEDVLPAKEAKRVSQLYNEKYQTIKKANQFNGDLKDDDIKQMAIQQALEQGVKESITQRSEAIVSGQVFAPDHPLAGRFTPESLVGLIGSADQRGLASFQQTYGLNDEEMATFLSGNPVPGKVTQADAAVLARIQTQELMMDLDSRESGLGKRYADWWVKNGSGYVQQTQQKNAQVASATGVQAQVMEGFANKIETEQMGAYSMILASAAEDYDGKKSERYQQMISFDLNPSHRQAALLQFDDSLTDGERQTFMKGFVLPIVAEAQKANRDYDDINTLIEQAIDANMTQDPQVAKILKKVAQNRPKIVNNLESVMGNTFWRPGPGQPRMGFQPHAWLRRTVAQRSYGWYEQLMQEGK